MKPAGDDTGAAITVHRCDTRAELEALRPAWNDLAARSARPSLYLTHEWMTDWWRSGGAIGRELFVLLARRKGEIAGIAPLVRIRRGVPGFGTTRLELMTMATYAYSPRNLSASLECIAAGGDTAPIRAIADFLAGHGDEWDYIRIHPLPEGSETLAEFTRWAKSRGYPFNARPVLANAVIDLPGDWEAYLRTLSPGFRKKLRRYANNIDRAGGFSVCEVTAVDDLEALLDQMADIESRSWKQTGGVGLGRPEVRRAYESQMRIALGIGGLSLWFLERGGKKIAFDLGIRYLDSVESLRGSYDRAFEEFSPGNHLIACELRAFAGRGVRRVNFLWGDLTYKLRWTKKTEAGHELYLFNRTARGRILHAAYVRSGLYRGIRFIRNYADRSRKQPAREHRTS